MISLLFTDYYNAVDIEEKERLLTALASRYHEMTDAEKFEYDSIVEDDHYYDGDEYLFDYDGDALASAGWGVDEYY